MKIAASDYDGTLFRHNIISEEDRNAISLWRARGNLFGLATGRDLSMVRNEIVKYRLELDFLVCNNGAALYDRGLEILAVTNLPAGAVRDVATHSSAKDSHYIIADKNGESYIREITPRSWLSDLDLPLIHISLEEILAMEGAQQVCLAFDSLEECADCVKALTRDFGNRFKSQENGLCLDVTAPGVDKGVGLEELLAAKNWRPQELLVIGDGENDLSMIRRFGGFTVKGAAPAVKAEAKIVYESVAAMLLAHL